MKCSICRTELVAGEMLRLETLDEHVCNPNGEIRLKQSFVCPNETCEANIQEILWNQWGDAYGTFGKSLPFVNGLMSAFGLFARQLEVEIHKHDEDYLLCSIPRWRFLPMKGWEIWVYFIYKSDEDGNILRRKRKLRFVNERHCWHVWGASMLWFQLKRIFSAWKTLRKNPNATWCREQLEDYANCSGFSTEREWWRRVSAVVARWALR